MKKGFTLIELLAVIIILAVIALIATPVVLNVVEDAKKEAAKNSAYGIIDAAKYQYMESLLDSSVIVENGKTYEAKLLPVSGEKPEGGTWQINTETGVITIANVQFGEYFCSGTVDNMNCLKTISLGGTMTGGTTGKPAINGVVIPAS